MKKRKTLLSAKFPKRLKELRQKRGWSQVYLAKQIDVEPNRISKYERGIIWPTLDMLVHLATVFEVSVDFLIREEKEIKISGMKNRDLLNQLEKIEELPTEYQTILISVIEAFIKRHKLEELTRV